MTVLNGTIPTVKAATDSDSNFSALYAASVSFVGADVDAHVTAINTLVTRLKEFTDDVEQAIGAHILAIKVAEPNEWEGIVKARCGLSRSRAYELMAIADGT